MKKEIAIVPQKEIVEYKNQLSFIKKSADRLVVKNQEDMEKGSDFLNQVKQVKKAVTDKKESVTRPLMEGLAAARDLFKPLESVCAEAEKTIKAKMLTYTEDKQVEIDKEKDRIGKRVEKGTMNVDTALDKIENLGEVGKTFRGDNGKVSVRTMRKVRIVDESLLPREYLVPDVKKITQVVLAGLVVPGAEAYEEKVIAAGSR